MKLTIPSYVKTVMDVLQSHGFEAHVVGGAVRDMLLGRVPDDYDVVTNARPEQILRTAEDAGIPVVSELGQNFGVVILRVERHGVEVAAYRNETYGSADAHRPAEVWYCRTLEEDLSRRDFTINALAVDQNGHITDCFQGLDDLRGRVLRTVGDPDRRFSEDALRMFRACLNAFYHPCHIAAEIVHCTHPLFILTDFIRCISMHHIPIIRSHDWHLIDGKMLIDHFQRCRCTATSGTYHCCPRLKRKFFSTGVKSTVKDRQKPSARMRIIDWGTKDKTISGLCLFDDFIYDIPKYTSTGFTAFSTAHTICDRLRTKRKDLRFHAAFIESARHLTECRKCTPFFFCTSIDQ